MIAYRFTQINFHSFIGATTVCPDPPSNDGPLLSTVDMIGKLLYASLILKMFLLNFEPSRRSISSSDLKARAMKRTLEKSVSMGFVPSPYRTVILASRIIGLVVLGCE
jgi:hypothetical protein